MPHRQQCFSLKPLFIKTLECAPSEVHNPSRSVSGTVCVFVSSCGKLRGEDSCVFNQLDIECVQHHICNHANKCSSLESDKFQRSLVVSPAVTCCSCLPWYNFCIERILWIGFKSKGLAKQLYRAIFVNCQGTVCCWKSVAVKKSKNIAVSKAP